MKKIDFVNKEYESRVMVSEEQYHQILSHYSKSRSKKEYSVNVNTYFDYDDLYLTQHHIVLRTRSINDEKYELTLKIKKENGDLELNHILNKSKYEDFNRNISIPESPILNKLKELSVEINRLKMLVELKTERLEIQYKDHLLVIDKNYFNNIVDYNVEVESYDKNAAKRYLLKHVLPFGVEYKKGYVSKSRRAINSVINY